MIHYCPIYPCPYCQPRCPTCGQRIGYWQHWHHPTPHWNGRVVETSTTDGAIGRALDYIQG